MGNLDRLLGKALDPHFNVGRVCTIHNTVLALNTENWVNVLGQGCTEMTSSSPRNWQGSTLQKFVAMILDPTSTLVLL